MGGTKILTYTLETESGISLKAKEDTNIWELLNHFQKVKDGQREQEDSGNQKYIQYKNIGGKNFVSLQLSMTFKKHIWSTPSEFKDLSGAREIAIDLETRDDGLAEGLGAGWALKKGNIIGFAVAVEGWQGYFPFGHFGGGNMIRDQVKAYIKEVCELPCPKIFHNAQYDVGWLLSEGYTVNGPIIDTMIAAALIDENRYLSTV